MQLLIATHNQGKKREYQTILGELGLELVALSDLGIDHEVEETGSTYEENALLKAETYARLTGLPTLADDSGLEVDALGGAPGVHSARYAGPGASDRDRYLKLLAALCDVPDPERSARFRCVIAIVWTDGTHSTVDGTCEGMIARKPRGDRGFGYDPIFYLSERGVTMAMLPPEIKNQISHRARAAEAAREIIRLRLA